MGSRRPSPDPLGTIPGSRPPIAAAAPPLIGVVTHELRAEPEPAWALAPRRRERDLAPQRLALRLTGRRLRLSWPLSPERRQT